jgi:DNA repair exonuclease SbcCD nuclease subunit
MVAPVTRFLHTSDWQLGMTRHFLGTDAQPRFTAARVEAISRIGRLAVEEHCDFVVVAGDVFESNLVERRVVVRALEAMAEQPALTYLLLPGNHDPLDATSVFRSPTFLHHQPPNVTVLETTAPIAVRPGVEVVGAPWVNKQPLTDLADDACEGLACDGTVRILVAHGATDSYSPDRDDPSVVSVEALRAHLRDRRIHYVALGDRHSTTDVADGRVWYSGAPEPTDYDEVAPGNVLVVDLDGGECSVTTRSVGTWRFIHHRAELTGDDDLDLLDRWFDAVQDKSRVIVKLSLVGQLSLRQMARLETLLEHQSDLLGAIERWDRRSDLVVLPDRDDQDDLGLVGFAREALDDLRSAALGDEDGAATARDALGLLYRLGSHGR